MKKSAYIAKLEQRLGLLAAQIAAEESEAAGVVWDPEEEPLPERLEVTPNGSYITYRDSDGHRTFVAIIDGDGTWDIAFARPAQCRLVMSEAVRRWNAWKEIRRLVECAVPSMMARRAFLTVLGGHEEGE